MNIHAVGVDIGHIAEGTAAILAQLHDIAHIFRRGINVRVDHRLLRLRDEGRVGIVGRVVDGDHLALSSFVMCRRRCGGRL